MGNYDVITSGYVSMDRIIKIDSPVKVGFTSLVTNKTNSNVYYGGCSVNIAYALSKLGIKAMPIIRVGDDYEELGFKKFLENSLVPLDGITKVNNESTSTCYLVQDNKNDHITIFYPGAMDGKYSQNLSDELFKGAKLGVITVASQADNKEFFKKCRSNNVPIIFGMKDDFDAFPEEFLKEILKYSNIIFTNEVEREIIEKIYGFKNITELFDIGSAEIIITTMGKDGSVVYQRDLDGVKETRIGVAKVENVVDATGSGDAYMSGFIYGYLNKFKIEDCCRLGGVLSSFVLEQEGCCTNMPTKEQLINKFNKNEEGF